MKNKVYYKSTYLYISLFFDNELAVYFVEDEQKRKYLLQQFKEFKQKRDIIRFKVDHVHEIIAIEEESVKKHLQNYLNYFVKE